MVIILSLENNLEIGFYSLLYSNIEYHVPSDHLAIQTSPQNSEYPRISIFNNDQDMVYVRYSSNFNSYVELQVDQRGLNIGKSVNGASVSYKQVASF